MQALMRFSFCLSSSSSSSLFCLSYAPRLMRSLAGLSLCGFLQSEVRSLQRRHSLGLGVLFPCGRKDLIHTVFLPWNAKEHQEWGTDGVREKGTGKHSWAAKAGQFYSRESVCFVMWIKEPGEYFTTPNVPLSGSLFHPLFICSLSLSLSFCLLICHLKGKMLSFSHFHVTSNLYDWLSSVEHKRRLTFCSSTYLVCSWFLKLHKSTTKLVHVVFNFGSSKAKTYLCQEGKVFNY